MKKAAIRFFTPQTDPVSSFILGDFCFIVGKTPSKPQIACGAYFDPKSDLSAALSVISSHFSDVLSCDLSEILFKVVSSTENLGVLVSALTAKNLRLESTVAKAPTTEIIFEAKLGRIRAKLSNDAAPVAAKTRVFIVDDSKTIRQLLTQLFSTDPSLEVVGSTGNPLEAESLIARLKPDVITLDIHMPGMDGVELLKKYLPKYPIPTLMISSLSMNESSHVFDALEFGAVDYVQKPSFDQISEIGPRIIDKIKTAKSVRVRPLLTSATVSPSFSKNAVVDTDTIIAIGSSTGGTEALKEVLTRLPASIPPVVIVQHIPPIFSKALADRLNSLCDFEVKEAEEGDDLKPSRVLIAPGGKQMRVVKAGTGFKVQINDAPPVNRHKPSVDYLFDSVAEVIGANTVGVILTGMGGDGARGMKKMKDRGSRTIAQDKDSCVVFGMPAEAIKQGGVDKVAPLLEIPNLLTHWLAKKKAA